MTRTMIDETPASSCKRKRDDDDDMWDLEHYSPTPNKKLWGMLLSRRTLHGSMTLGSVMARRKLELGNGKNNNRGVVQHLPDGVCGIDNPKEKEWAQMHASAPILVDTYREGSHEAWADQYGPRKNTRRPLNENEIEALSVQMEDVELKD